MNTQGFSIENGRYQIIGKLGEGGMAAVFRAYDTLLKVERAIKVLSPEYARHSQIRERFVTEASTMARLHHKYIVMVHDIKPEGTPVYMVMEMLKGGSLMDRVEDFGVLHAQLAIDATIAMVEGLGFAHKNKVIHRDVKPHNVLLDENGIPKVTDFGIARLEDDNSGKTKTGAVMGTFAYMAPEQRISARRATAQSDLYAAGASMYVLMTNQNPAEIFVDDMQDRMMEGFDPNVKEFIKKACHFNAKERYADSKEMADALRELKSIVEPLPEGTTPLFANSSGLRPMKELSENEISVVQEQWHSWCHTTPPTGGMAHQPNSSSIQTMAFDGNDDGSSKTMGFDFMDEEVSQTITAEAPEAAQTIMPTQDSTGTIIEPQGSQTSPFPVNQPPPPTPKRGGLFVLLTLAVVFGFATMWYNNKLEKEEQAARTQAELEKVEAARAEKEALEAKRLEEEKAKERQTELSKKVPAVTDKDQKTILTILGNPTWAIDDKVEVPNWPLPENSELLWVWKNENCPPVQISFKMAENKESYDIVSIEDGWQEGNAACLDEGDYASSKLPPSDYLCENSKISKLCSEYQKPRRVASSSAGSSSSSGSSASSASNCDPSVTGRLKVNSRPWSNMTLNGSSSGTKIDKEVPACSHRIRMTTNDGRTKTISLTVREDQTKVYCWDFDQSDTCSR